MKSLALSLAAAALAAGLSTPAMAADGDWAAVAQALGKSGAEMPGGVYRVAFPRSDLKETLDGVDLKPGFAFGGWLAFKMMGKQAMVMGDLVLTEAEVGPVTKKMEEGGVEITALHNHLLRNQPFTMYMHVGAQGDPVKLATALHNGLAESKIPMTAPAASGPPPAIDFDTAAVDGIMGYKGKNNGGIYGFTIERASPVKDEGMEIPAAMGSATGINFQPTGGGKAAITGDFVLIGSEVNPVLKALRENGIEVTAVHSHMLDEQPRLFFMHFWANDDAQKLARGLKAALGHMSNAKS
jgi:hypothetical protein